jgi:ribosome-associated protein
LRTEKAQKEDASVAASRRNRKSAVSDVDAPDTPLARHAEVDAEDAGAEGFDDADESENSISKSEMKRRMLALQAVGEELVRQPIEVLRKFDLPERLFDAIVATKRINPNKHGAMYRQMQYVGKLMRGVDAPPIVEKLEALKAPSRKETALHHLAEQWRTRLLADPTSVGAFRSEFIASSELDASAANEATDAIATLIPKAREEHLKRQPPKYFRLLYKALLKHISAKAS